MTPCVPPRCHPPRKGCRLPSPQQVQLPWTQPWGTVQLVPTPGPQLPTGFLHHMPPACAERRLQAPFAEAEAARLDALMSPERIPGVQANLPKSSGSLLSLWVGEGTEGQSARPSLSPEPETPHTAQMWAQSASAAGARSSCHHAGNHDNISQGDGQLWKPLPPRHQPPAPASQNRKSAPSRHPTAAPHGALWRAASVHSEDPGGHPLSQGQPHGPQAWRSVMGCYEHVCTYWGRTVTAHRGSGIPR